MSDDRVENSDVTPTTLNFFTVTEVASILGISRRLVSNWIHQGALPAIRLGPGRRLLRIRRVDLEDFVNRGEIQPPSDRPSVVNYQGIS